MSRPSDDASPRARPGAARPDDAVEFAYRRVRQAILDGALAPGAILSQVRLAGEFGISRTPLREALGRLEIEGLITSDFNRRVRVSELDLDDFDQIYAIRMTLEPVAIRATIGELEPNEFGELTEHLAAMDAAIEASEMAEFRVHHRQFHLGLSSHAGSRIVRLLEDLWDNSERYRLAYLHYDLDHQGSALVDRLRTSQVEHRALLDAAAAGDAEECARLEVLHLSRTLDGVFRDAARLPSPRASRGAIVHT
ncbi:GntR family transcriptional regulator [Agromyces salentinus]|uniref:GntR family transcriptional regulator n=1 Tax=Agromyces salentinus TaxID=269421 RepID=A0ABN2N0I6_9MICO|nr:GntR family transcriptional regulator [Agromyces salentinus]